MKKYHEKEQEKERERETGEGEEVRIIKDMDFMKMSYHFNLC